jgi:hypothetical protein
MTALALIGLLAERMMMASDVTLTQAVSLSRQEDARMKEPTIRVERVTPEEYRPQLTSQQLAELIGGDVASGDA